MDNMTLSHLVTTLHSLFECRFSFLDLVLFWVVSLVFCWKLYFRRENLPEDKSEVKDLSVIVRPLNVSNKMPPPSFSPSSIKPRSPEIPSSLNQSMSRSGGKFLRQLELEVCQKAKEAGKHPSYSSLVLSLIHNYNLDINKPVLPKGFTIFHSACLSCNLELVTSLSPMAELSQTTSQGETPLYLAVYAACYRMDGQPEVEQDGLEVVKHLLEAGCDVNYPNHNGWTPLHQANRLGHSRMIRLLLDEGAKTKTGLNSTISSPRSYSSVTTRSMSRRLNTTLNAQ